MKLGKLPARPEAVKFKLTDYLTLPTPRRYAKRPMTYMKFAAKMRKTGITDVAEIKAHWDVYKAEANA